MFFWPQFIMILQNTRLNETFQNWETHTPIAIALNFVAINGPWHGTNSVAITGPWHGENNSTQHFIWMLRPECLILQLTQDGDRIIFNDCSIVSSWGDY